MWSSHRRLVKEAQLLSPLDPKSDWALRHPEFFPVELNKAPYEVILRVPGIGVPGWPPQSSGWTGPLGRTWGRGGRASARPWTAGPRPGSGPWGLPPAGSPGAARPGPSATLGARAAATPSQKEPLNVVPAVKLDGELAELPGGEGRPGQVVGGWEYGKRRS